MANTTSQNYMNETARMLANAHNTPAGYVAAQKHISESAHALARDLIAAHDETEADFDIAAQGPPDAAMATLLQKLDEAGGKYQASKDNLEALKRLIRDEGLDFAQQTRARPFYARLAVMEKSPDDLPPCRHYHYIVLDAETDTHTRRNTQLSNAPHLTIFGTQSSQSRLPHLGPIAAQPGKKALLIYFASMNAEDEAPLGFSGVDIAQDTPTRDGDIASPDIMEQGSEAPQIADFDEDVVPAWTDEELSADKAPDDILAHAGTGTENEEISSHPSSSVPQTGADENIPDLTASGDEGFVDDDHTPKVVSHTTEDDSYVRTMTPVDAGDTKEPAALSVPETVSADHGIVKETPNGEHPQDQSQVTLVQENAPDQSAVFKPVGHINARPSAPVSDTNITSHPAINTQTGKQASAIPEQAQTTRQQNTVHKVKAAQLRQSPQGAVYQTHRNDAVAAAAEAVNGQTRLQVAFHQHSHAPVQQPQPTPPVAGHIPANDVTPGTPVGGKPDSGSASITTESVNSTDKDKTSQSVEQDTGQKTGPSTSEQTDTPASPAKPESPQSPEEGLRSHPPGCGCQLCSGDKSSEEAQQAPDADALFGPEPDTQAYTPMTNEACAGSSGPETEIAKHPPGCGCKLCSGESSGEKAVQSADPFADLASSGPDNAKHRGRHPEPV